MPCTEFLDEAEAAGLIVFAGLDWPQNGDFFREPCRFSTARVKLAEALREIRHHRALAGIYVGNEIPADLVRWMKPVKTRRAIEELIDETKQAAPHLLCAYANYPTTEYLEPANADFTAMNVYLETPEAFRNYIKRLHHIAGDRPVVISEFGIDSRRNGSEKQTGIMEWALRIALEEHAAGFTAYSWSDSWWNRGRLEDDWDFGLTDRAGNPKPVLAVFQQRDIPETPDLTDFSVIVCTRNGLSRIGACLTAIRAMRGNGFETIVIDDGSVDGTAEFITANHPWVRLERLKPCGLSAARNVGAAIARGDILAYTDDDCEPDIDWLANLHEIFSTGHFAAAGGPNLPPPPTTREAAVVAAAPGAPSHVMLNDVEAEHLPGCNLAVTRAAFNAIGGFDPVFHTAGDDVDFCWRLRDAGFRLGFAPAAFVWHHRRPYIAGFLCQQIGYGHAEKLLMKKHSSRFSKHGGAKWEGFVYGGGPVRVRGNSRIDHGDTGDAAYQHVIDRLLPLRGLPPRWNDWKSRALLWAVERLVPLLRGWVRCRRLRFRCPPRYRSEMPVGETTIVPGRARESVLAEFRENGWVSAEEPEWDLRKNKDRIVTATEWFDDGSCRTLVRKT
ncbi:MAG: glycosyltransferase [Verrucomicrobiota bacterium]